MSLAAAISLRQLSQQSADNDDRQWQCKQVLGVGLQGHRLLRVSWGQRIYLGSNLKEKGQNV